MKAFTGSVSKAELLKEVLKHQELDNYVQGTYFIGGKGCAVGCAIESINRLKGTITRNNDHEFLSDQTQVPLWLIRLQDGIFEGLSEDESKLWPCKFTSAINEGSDLGKILNPFLIKTIESTSEAYDNEKYRAVKEAQDLVIKGLEENNKDILIKGRKSAAADAAAYAAYAAEAANDAEAAAYAADTAAAYAADAAAYAAYAAEAANDAEAAAYAAAAYAAEAANDAEAAAYAADTAAAYAAEAANDAEAAAYAAEAIESHWLKLSNELIKLMKGCK